MRKQLTKKAAHREIMIEAKSHVKTARTTGIQFVTGDSCIETTDRAAGICSQFSYKDRELEPPPRSFFNRKAIDITIATSALRI